MADRPLFTNAAALTGAAAIGASIADPTLSPPTVGKVRLFDSTLVPDIGTTVAELEAAEIVTASYPAGGYDLDEFSSPVYAPGGGALITSNLINVVYTTGDAVSVGGYWVEDAASPDPNVREVFIYDPPRSLGVIGNGWPIAVQLGYGANSLV